MQLIVPMAGLGKRFADAGYSIPKPLIPIGGVPMVVRVVRALPAADRIVFIVHPDHVAAAGPVLEGHFPGATVVVPPRLTDGQACSTRLGCDHLDPDRPVLVAACDATFLYSRERFANLTADPDVAAVVWTYRREPRVLVRPEWYGWVGVGPDGTRVTGVSVKKPISDRPLDDHVVTGTFWFARTGELAGAIDRLVASERRVNGEFYLDAVPNLFIERGARVAAFEVEKYIGWGTPDDLTEYRAWERHFRERDGVA